MGMNKMPKATSGSAATSPQTAKIPASGKTKVMKKGPMQHIDSGKPDANANWGSGHAGQQVPGQSAAMGTSSAKFASGGKNSMFPRGSATPQVPGKSAGRG